MTARRVRTLDDLPPELRAAAFEHAMRMLDWDGQGVGLFWEPEAPHVYSALPLAEARDLFGTAAAAQDYDA